jgi:hypothetical protein
MWNLVAHKATTGFKELFLQLRKLLEACCLLSYKRLHIPNIFNWIFSKTSMKTACILLRIWAISCMAVMRHCLRTMLRHCLRTLSWDTVYASCVYARCHETLSTHDVMRHCLRTMLWDTVYARCYETLSTHTTLLYLLLGSYQILFAVYMFAYHKSNQRLFTGLLPCVNTILFTGITAFMYE